MTLGANSKHCRSTHDGSDARVACLLVAEVLSPVCAQVSGSSDGVAVELCKSCGRAHAHKNYTERQNIVAKVKRRREGEREREKRRRRSLHGTHKSTDTQQNINSRTYIITYTHTHSHTNRHTDTHNKL